MNTVMPRRLSIVSPPKSSNPLRLFLAVALISTCCFMPAPLCAQPAPLYRLHMPTDTDSTNPQAGVPGSGAPAPAAAASARSSFAPEHIEVDRIFAPNTAMFKGVDTIVVRIKMFPMSQELIEQGDPALSTITDEVQKVFADAVSRVPINQLKVLPFTNKDHDDLDVAFLRKANVILLTFVFSARTQSVGGKTVTAASMTWGIGKNQEPSLMPISQGSAYPFVVPDDKEEKLQVVRDAVAHNLAPLLLYFSCADKYGPPSHECPDCSLEVCKHLPSLMVQP